MIDGVYTTKSVEVVEWDGSIAGEGLGILTLITIVASIALPLLCILIGLVDISINGPAH